MVQPSRSHIVSSTTATTFPQGFDAFRGAPRRRARRAVRRRRPRNSLLYGAALGVLLLCAACQDRSDRIRVAHDSSRKSTALDNGELAGRVVFAVQGQGVAAAGASIILVDTDTGKQILEHLQKEPELDCLKRLTGMETFVLNLAQADAHAGRPPLTTTADADGYFILPQVKPGAYLVIAYGRANSLQAIWEQPAIVERYQGVMVKLVDPLLTCAESKAEAPALPPVVPSAPAPGRPQPPAGPPPR